MKYKNLHIREGTGDKAVIDEVVTKYGYRRSQIDFDVKRGEVWLDLGANIGAFAEYCRLQKAKHVISYEPDRSCYTLLEETTVYECHQKCVTGFSHRFISFYQHSNTDNFSRGSIHELRNHRSKTKVLNVNIADLCDQKFDGIKMDIEGSEFSILDSGKLPKCSKLVLEYHTSRDSSVSNLRRRLSFLQKVFKHVKYPPEYDRVFKSGVTEFKSFFDRLIFCWN